MYIPKQNRVVHDLLTYYIKFRNGKLVNIKQINHMNTVSQWLHYNTPILFILPIFN